MRISITTLCLALSACQTPVRYGVTTVPAAQASTNESVVQAIQKALAEKEAECPVHVIDRTPPTANGNVTDLVATAVVCNNLERYAVRIAPNADQVTISAHRLQ